MPIRLQTFKLTQLSFLLYNAETLNRLPQKMARCKRQTSPRGAEVKGRTDGASPCLGSKPVTFFPLCSWFLHSLDLGQHCHSVESPEQFCSGIFRKLANSRTLDIVCHAVWVLGKLTVDTSAFYCLSSQRFLCLSISVLLFFLWSSSYFPCNYLITRKTLVWHFIWICSFLFFI